MRVLHINRAVSTALAFLSIQLSAVAAPVSDGSIFKETFTSYPENSHSAAIGPGANVVSGFMHIETTTGTEGVFRAANLGIPASIEYVMEYDYRVNSNSGDNFYLLYTQGASAPYEQDIKMRVYDDNSSPSTWEFQIDDNSPPTWHQHGGFNYGQWYHFTVHHTNNPSSDIAVYVDGALLGTYTDRVAGLGVDLAQFGDSSGGAGYGNADVDNVSIGAPVVPEPASLSLLTAGFVTMRRRRSAAR
jgi:hypothetical protein